MPITPEDRNTVRDCVVAIDNLDVGSNPVLNQQRAAIVRMQNWMNNPQSSNYVIMNHQEAHDLLFVLHRIGQTNPELGLEGRFRATMLRLGHPDLLAPGLGLSDGLASNVNRLMAARQSASPAPPVAVSPLTPPAARSNAVQAAANAEAHIRTILSNRDSFTSSPDGRHLWFGVHGQGDEFNRNAVTLRNYLNDHLRNRLGIAPTVERITVEEYGNFIRIPIGEARQAGLVPARFTSEYFPILSNSRIGFREGGVTFGDNPTVHPPTFPAPQTPPSPQPLNYGTHQEQGSRTYQEDRVFVRDTPLMTESQARQLLEQTTQTLVHRTSGHQRSGSTFTGAIITQNGNVVTSHLGDSPAAAIIYDPQAGRAEVVRLTSPHTPSQEPLSIVRNGQEVFEFGGRVMAPDGAGLAVNRALGDARFGNGVTHTPDITVHDLSRYRQQGRRVFLLAGSDGLLSPGSGITLEGHAQTLAARLRANPNASLADAARAITQNSLGSHDNVTATLVEVIPGRGAIVGVFDGHGGAQTSQTALETFAGIVNNVRQQGVDQVLTAGRQRANPPPIPPQPRTVPPPLSATPRDTSNDVRVHRVVRLNELVRDNFPMVYHVDGGLPVIRIVTENADQARNLARAIKEKYPPMSVTAAIHSRHGDAVQIPLEQAAAAGLLPPGVTAANAAERLAAPQQHYPGDILRRPGRQNRGRNFQGREVTGMPTDPLGMSTGALGLAAESSAGSVDPRTRGGITPAPTPPNPNPPAGTQRPLTPSQLMARGGHAGAAALDAMGLVRALMAGDPVTAGTSAAGAVLNGAASLRPGSGLFGRLARFGGPVITAGRLGLDIRGIIRENPIDPGSAIGGAVLETGAGIAGGMLGGAGIGTGALALGVGATAAGIIGTGGAALVGIGAATAFKLAEKAADEALYGQSDRTFPPNLLTKQNMRALAARGEHFRFHGLLANPQTGEIDWNNRDTLKKYEGLLQRTIGTLQSQVHAEDFPAPRSTRGWWDDSIIRQEDARRDLRVVRAAAAELRQHMKEVQAIAHINSLASDPSQGLTIADLNRTGGGTLTQRDKQRITELLTERAHDNGELARSFLESLRERGITFDNQRVSAVAAMLPTASSQTTPQAIRLEQERQEAQERQAFITMREAITAREENRQSLRTALAAQQSHIHVVRSGPHTPHITIRGGWTSEGERNAGLHDELNRMFISHQYNELTGDITITRTPDIAPFLPEAISQQLQPGYVAPQPPNPLAAARLERWRVGSSVQLVPIRDGENVPAIGTGGPSSIGAPAPQGPPQPTPH